MIQKITDLEYMIWIYKKIVSLKRNYFLFKYNYFGSSKSKTDNIYSSTSYEDKLKLEYFLLSFIRKFLAPISTAF